MATYYVDVATGNNTDTGLSEALAWADPGYAAQQMAEGDWCYVKSGTYTISSATLGAGGPVKFSAAAGKRCGMEGYYSSPGDRAMNGATFTPPLLQATVGSIKICEGDGTFSDPHVFAYLSVDGNAQTGITGFFGDNVGWCLAVQCYAEDCDTDGFKVVTCVQCKAYDCNDGFDDCVTMYCVSDANAVGFACSAAHTIVHGCIAANNTGDGFQDPWYSVLSNCVAYNNGGDGFQSATGSNTYVACIAAKNGGYGFNSNDSSQYIGCAVPGVGATNIANASGNFNAAAQFTAGTVTLTYNGDPFLDASTGDFRPDNISGGGALLRAAGLDPYGQTGAIDIGAVQHADPTLPAVEDVEAGVQFGADGTEFTGTLAAGGGVGNLINGGLIK